MLDQRDLVSSMLIPYTNQNGFTPTGDEDIVFMVDGDAIFGKDGNSVVVS